MDLSELDSIVRCEAWIKREYPSACVYVNGTAVNEDEYYASVYDVGRIDERAYAETPLLAIQSVCGQIIKWRQR